jgi:hypothetical protein
MGNSAINCIGNTSRIKRKEVLAMQNTPSQIQFSEHSLRRLAHRNLSTQDISYVIAHGTKYYGGGVTTYYLRECDLPPRDVRFNTYSRLVGTAALVASDGTIVTVWRNRKTGLKNIKHKQY